MEGINRPIKGMFTDGTPQFQPADTYLFALNAVTETEAGEVGFLSNEESNTLSASVSKGYHIIGHCFIGDNNVCIFSTNPTTHLSEIGIFNTNKNTYTKVVNDGDEKIEGKFNFHLEHQIQAIHRLRRGCERIVYWTDGINKPRKINLDKGYLYTSTGKHYITDYDLQKDLLSIPRFKKDVTKVLDSGGSLKAGTYNIAIQYLDNFGNTTEWTNVTNNIFIYNNLSTENYNEITGSMSTDSNQFLNYPNTSKAIQVTIEGFHPSYSQYKLAFLEANNGTGNIVAVRVTGPLSTNDPTFIYTGSNYAETIPLNDILAVNAIVDSAKHIDQLDSKLILSNVVGTDINWCEFQKYASKIQANCVIRGETKMHQMQHHWDPKNALCKYEQGTGYMPGEIYAFGIVYILSNGETSPVFHIPGKSHVDEDAVVYGGKRPANIKGMSTDNQILTTYRKAECNDDYWGVDYHEKALVNTKVRHHRFPTRQSLKIPHIAHKKDSTGEEYDVTSTFGIEFLNIEKPVIKTSSVQVIGYKIVQQERTEENKTVLDTGILLPAIKYKEYIGIGVLSPEDLTDDERAKIGRKPRREERLLEGQVAALLNNEFKFNDTLYYGGIDIKQQGWFVPQLDLVAFDPKKPDEKTVVPRVQYGYNIYNDVAAGSVTDDSWKANKDINVDRLDDHYQSDGMTLLIASRDTSVEYTIGDSWNKDPIANNFSAEKIEFIKPLRSYDSISVKGDVHTRIFNVAGDQNINVIKLNTGNFYFADKPHGISYPFVTINRKLEDPYSNFMLNPYYQTHLNYEVFEGEKTASVEFFNGDVQVTPLRYDTTMYVGNRAVPLGQRDLNFWEKFGTTLAMFASFIVIGLTAGLATTPLLIAAGIIGSLGIAAGGVMMTIAANHKYDDFNRMIRTEYLKGLKNTIFDRWIYSWGATSFSPWRYHGVGDCTLDSDDNKKPGGWLGRDGLTQDYNAWHTIVFENKVPLRDGGHQSTNTNWHGSKLNGFTDDTVIYATDCITSFYLESTVNTALRNKLNNDLPGFLPVPGVWEKYKHSVAVVSGPSNNTTPILVVSHDKLPMTTLERHIEWKLFTLNKEGKRVFTGMTIPEFYKINPDYTRRNGVKPYFHLPSHYDCCSKCREKFSHRWMWSETSLDEQIQDNYSVFKANNYKDIPGDTGEITNIVTLNNQLYLHTEDALWVQPRSYQERVTDEIVTYIGSGEYGQLPPRKLIDDTTGLSAGLQHKWGALKTRLGYIFVSEKERGIYVFTGSLNSISNRGMKQYFETNLKTFTENENLLFNTKDNPSNPDMNGFLIGYDGLRDRILITKRDSDRYFFGPNTNDDTAKDYPLRIGDLVFKTTQDELYDNVINKGYKVEGIYWHKKTPKDTKELPFLRLVKQYGNSRVSTQIEIEGVESNWGREYNDYSWTMSYSMLNQSWTSFHSYIPHRYITDGLNMYTVKDNNIWKHGTPNEYQSFYNTLAPHIIEYVDNTSPIQNKITDHILIGTSAIEKPKGEVPITFNNAVLYNTQQCSGTLQLVPKSDPNVDTVYMGHQVMDEGVCLIDRNEGTWMINAFRDMRVDYAKPIWDKELATKRTTAIFDATKYTSSYIDKLLNTSTMSHDKAWVEQEPFRDKFLVVRLEFGRNTQNKAVKLITRYNATSNTPSIR